MKSFGYIQWREILGQGSFGTVVRATRIADEHDVAMKIMDIWDKADKEVSNSIGGYDLVTTREGTNVAKLIDVRHEIKMMTTLRGAANIIRYLDHLCINGMVYIVMEIEAGTLSQQLRRYVNGMSERKARKWFKHIVSGINFMHYNGIVHRDIKPGNVMIQRLGDGSTMCRIADFGLSRFIKRPKKEGEADPSQYYTDPIPKTADGCSMLKTVCGTAEFYAPELVKRHRLVRDIVGEQPRFDGRLTDVWALGVTFFKMLFNLLPFDSDLARNPEKKFEFLNALECQDYHIPLEYKYVLSHNAKELLRQTMMPHVKQRLNSDQLLLHPWFNGEVKEPGFRQKTHKSIHGAMRKIRRKQGRSN